MMDKYKILNRDAIKYIAMFLMLLNHISTIFMKSGKLWSELFIDLGYFTAIVMCYFLVEGYQYTHSKKNYAIRLLIFALISEFPYCFAFTESGILEFQGLNMLFTLLICFCILTVVEKVYSFKNHLCVRVDSALSDFGLGIISTYIYIVIYLES